MRSSNYPIVVGWKTTVGEIDLDTAVGTGGDPYDDLMDQLHQLGFKHQRTDWSDDGKIIYLKVSDQRKLH